MRSRRERSDLIILQINPRSNDVKKENQKAPDTKSSESGTVFEKNLKTSRKSKIFLTLEVVTSKMSNSIPKMKGPLLDADLREIRIR